MLQFDTSLLLVAALILGGCFSETSAANPDGGATESDSGIDASLALDGGGPSCPGAIPDFACDTFFPAEQSFDIPILWGANGSCYCGETTACTATLEEDGTIQLRATQCDGSCEACLPTAQGTCTIPPLSEGDHDVYIEGHPAFTIRAHDPNLMVFSAPECQSVAPAPTTRCGAAERVDMPANEVCFSPSDFPGQYIRVEVSNTCGNCAQSPGSCEAEVRDDTIFLLPEMQQDACEAPLDCPAVCETKTVECFIPPLEAGTYDLYLPNDEHRITDALIISDTPAGAAPTCVGVTR